MLKISEFCKLAQISTRTLRYYEGLGLIAPAEVDTFTGYRYYTVAQLPRLYRILVFKDLGFELSEIGDFLDREVSPEEVHRTLQRKKAELQRRIQDDQQRLERIEVRLKQIELRKIGGIQNVVLKQIPAQTVVSQWGTASDFVPNFELAEQVRAWVRHLGLKPIGPLHYVFHTDDQPRSTVAVEAAMPILMPAASPTIDALHWGQLPAVDLMATLLYYGSPYDIFQAYEGLGQWIQEHGYSIVGDCRKIILPPDGDTYVTEIQFPISKLTH